MAIYGDIYGEICEKIYKLVDLEVLSLDHNALSGEVPPKIKKLKKLIMKCGHQLVTKSSLMTST